MSRPSPPSYWGGNIRAEADAAICVELMIREGAGLVRAGTLRRIARLSSRRGGHGSIGAAKHAQGGGLGRRRAMT